MIKDAPSKLIEKSTDHHAAVAVVKTTHHRFQ